MAKGDTKTNQYLDIAANGTRADLPADACCETRSQTLIREVAERIIGVEEEVEELKNNPDVVDIVDTYADLQNYDTSGLTDKDIIRVIADETKDGLSSYYRWNSPNAGWNFVGVIPGGDGIKELSSVDYNYPENNPNRVALWLLDNGLYAAPAGVMVAASTTSYPWYNTSDKTILVGGSDTVKGIYTFLNGKVDVVTTQVSDGVEADEYTLLNSNEVLQTTGQSTTDVMSQKAVTDALAGISGVTELTTADYNYDVGNTGANNTVALWKLSEGIYITEDTSVNISPSSSNISAISPRAWRQYSGVAIVGSNDGYGKHIVMIHNRNAGINRSFRGITHVLCDNSSGSSYGYYSSLDDKNIVNSLDATDSGLVLDARQGKVLKDMIDNLPTGGGATELTTADYNWNGSTGSVTEPYNCVALWLLDSGIYSNPNGVDVIDSTSGSIGHEDKIWIINSASQARTNIFTLEGGDTSSNIKTVMKNNGFLESTALLKPPVQTIGTSTADVMSQNATTSMIYADPETRTKIRIGKITPASEGNHAITIRNEGSGSTAGLGIAIGDDTQARGVMGVAIGTGADTGTAIGCVAIGSFSAVSGSQNGVVSFGGSTLTSGGYNNSNYRLLTNVYDPQSDHDAATKGYVDTQIGTIDTALQTLLNGTGA